jgi:peptidoglycan hydrolase-like protein with peptidoglycan-binding domain
MKKLTFTLFFLAIFIFSGFGVNRAQAYYDAGCTGAGPYSILSGMLCSGTAPYTNYYPNTTPTYSSTILGCYGTNAYSTITGAPCYQSQYYTQPTYNTTYTQPTYNTTFPSFGTQPVVYNFTQVLSIGSTGEDVITLQQILQNQGYAVGTVDGVYGYNTERAVSNYQSSHGLNPTGIADLQTLNSLVSATATTNTYITSPYTTTPYNNSTSSSCIPTILNGVTTNNCGSYYNSPTTYYNPTTPNYNSTGLYPTYNTGTTVSATSSVSGSQTLNIGQQGSWTVTVYNTYNASLGNLLYSVNWGDAQYGDTYGSITSPQPSATFTHVYTQAETYDPIFTVTTNVGQVVTQTNLSVTVSGNSNYYGYSIPTISYLSPSSGIVGTQVTVFGTGFGYNGCNGSSCGNYTNTVNFGGTTIPNVYSYNGTSLTFSVPSTVNNNCQVAGQYCNQNYTQLTPGTYPVSITNQNGTSNSILFTVYNYTY